ncbi:hypothetical protein TCDM_03458 [Trypanosoma cruzi Dm28c]|uniref:Uncharacterized protein n=1 Tax=Trypanosoma cruzi Dm28c TaxID=1416333 RepID=V5BNL8_TRYCR|nr:hypothetical protein TCDM_03458 [Trypanosoma cruzi Dm28c]
MCVCVCVEGGREYLFSPIKFLLCGFVSPRTGTKSFVFFECAPFFFFCGVPTTFLPCWCLFFFCICCTRFFADMSQAGYIVARRICMIIICFYFPGEINTFIRVRHCYLFFRGRA